MARKWNYTFYAGANISSMLSPKSIFFGGAFAATVIFDSTKTKMKLLTHNMLTSKGLKGVSVGYPLGIMAKDIKVSEVDFNSELIVRVIPKLDWPTLWKAAESIGHVGELPQTLIQDFETNEDFLKKVHHVLLEVEVINGDLLCPESGRKFPINDGIPNMLLNEDEV